MTPQIISDFNLLRREFIQHKKSCSKVFNPGSDCNCGYDTAGSGALSRVDEFIKTALFNNLFANKIKELGIDRHLLEEYSALKMRVRGLEREIQKSLVENPQNLELVGAAVAAVHDGTIDNAWAEIKSDLRMLTKMRDIGIQRLEIIKDLESENARLRDEIRAITTAKRQVQYDPL